MHITVNLVYTDDDVGNLTGRLSEMGITQTLKWSHENWLVEVKSSNLLTETYGYDEAGQRAKRTTVAKVGASHVTTTTYYTGAGQEVQNGVPVRYYSLGGNTLGVRQGAGVSWLYGDHLGSTSASSGAASTSERYYAYCKDRGTGNLPTGHRFTGQISDASGLVFMNARYYDPVLGSFLSPDSLVPEPGQPEGYNRYAYANWNPFGFTDPSGHAAFCIQGGANPELDEGSTRFISHCHDILAAGSYTEEQYGPIIDSINSDSEQLENWQKAVEARGDTQPIIIIGHSFGGEAAITLANLIDNAPVFVVPVDLLVTIDKEGWAHDLANYPNGFNGPYAYLANVSAWRYDNTKPSNVDLAINIAADPPRGIPEWSMANG